MDITHITTLIAIAASFYTTHSDNKPAWFTEWTKSTSAVLPIDSVHAATGYYNGSIFIIGGSDRHQNESDSIIQYDIANDTVTLLNTTHGPNGTFPNGTIYHDGQASVQIGNQIYGVRKGHDRELFVFDLETLKMADPFLVPDETPNMDHESCIAYSEYRNTMYIIRRGASYYINMATKEWGDFPVLILINSEYGYSCTVDPTYHYLWVLAFQTGYIYQSGINMISTENIQNQTWGTGPVLPHRIRYAVLTAHQDHIMVISGGDDDERDSLLIASENVYTIALNDNDTAVTSYSTVNVVKKGVAEKVPSDEYGVYAAASIVVNGTVYLFGGATNFVNVSNRYRWVQSLDFYQEPAPSPSPRSKPWKIHLSPTAVVILIASCGVVALVAIAIYAKRRSDREKKNEYFLQNAAK